MHRSDDEDEDDQEEGGQGRNVTEEGEAKVVMMPI
jgi:hypothetical protein